MGHRSGVTGERETGKETRRWPASAHEASRFLSGHLPAGVPVDALPTDTERYGYDEPPRLSEPKLIEGETFQSIHVADQNRVVRETGFGGFLDGTQDLQPVSQIAGISVLWATVSAAVRVRVNRRLVTWGERAPIVSGRYYLPFRYVSDLPGELRDDPRVVDTAKADRNGKFPSRHPAALVEAAIVRIRQDRERIEQELAEAWCRSEQSVLFVDGSITGSRDVASSTRAIGVVKSHRQLYVDDKAFPVLVDLKLRDRSSIFQVDSGTRSPVASWYLRLRNASGRDALFGLVRVEASLSDDISSRADEISRWILAEGAPLALPDGRWDKMAYGIRDTEEFLRAIT